MWMYSSVFFLLHHMDPPLGWTTTGLNRHSPMCTLTPLPYTDHRTVIRLSNRVANGCWSAIVLLRPGGGVTRKLYNTGLNDAAAGPLSCVTADFDLQRWCFGPPSLFEDLREENMKEKKTFFLIFFLPRSRFMKVYPLFDVIPPFRYDFGGNS